MPAKCLLGAGIFEIEKKKKSIFFFNNWRDSVHWYSNILYKTGKVKLFIKKISYVKLHDNFLSWVWNSKWYANFPCKLFHYVLCRTEKLFFLTCTEDLDSYIMFISLQCHRILIPILYSLASMKILFKLCKKIEMQYTFPSKHAHPLTETIWKLTGSSSDPKFNSL